MQSIIDVSMHEMINWGIIGCGDVTEIKSGPAFNKVSNTSLVAVMRRDKDKAADYAKRHHVPLWFNDASELIHHPSVNAIYIATPPKFHEDYAIEAIKAGKPVYVEKPMSVDVASCIRMEEAAKKSGVKLCIAHYRRALPKFIHIKNLLDEKRIGDIRTVHITLLASDTSEKVSKSWRVMPELAGAGLFYDLAPHQIDLLFYFFNNAIASFGYATNQAGFYGSEDLVTGMIELENNILVTGTWCFTVAKGTEKDLFEIIGSKGKISFSVFGHEIEIDNGLEKEVLHFIPPMHIQEPMIEKIVHYFSGIGENPCSATEAIKSMSIMEQFVYGHLT
jgi:predicted dehydrogenase